MERREFLAAAATAAGVSVVLQGNSASRTDDDTYDVIVVGVGTMGSATCYWLARRGLRVLGLEQFDISHDQGSHAGQSRIIRKAYFEHPNYVPLLNRAYENWKQLETETGAAIYHKTGLLYYGRADSPMIRGVRLSAEKYNVPVDELTTEDAKVKFPGVRIPPGWSVLFEPDAGFVTPERAILTFTESAIRRGAVIRTREHVQSWDENSTGVTVTTSSGTFHAKHLVFTSGSWTSKLLKLPTSLKVTRQSVAWFNPMDAKPFTIGNFPCWISDIPNRGSYYGFPMLPVADFGGPIGLKLAHHTPQLESDPDKVNRDVSRNELDDLQDYVKSFMPRADSRPISVKTCLYTYSKDEDFIIDKLPGYNRVTFACGFSGHGFKFASVVGEILADMATQGRTSLPAEFLSLKRFS